MLEPILEESDRPDDHMIISMLPTGERGPCYGLCTENTCVVSLVAMQILFFVGLLAVIIWGFVKYCL